MRDVPFLMIVNIYFGKLRRFLFATPCQSWSLLYQNLGAGTRTRDLWAGLCRVGIANIDFLGNVTLGATLLLMSIIYACGGSFTFEHPLSAMSWHHPGLRAVMGWHGAIKHKIEQCAYGLRPSDCPKKRYQKRTGILAVGSGVFIARRCIHNHEHIPILGSVHGCQQVNGGGRVHKTIGQSSGHLPPVLCLIYPHILMNPLHSRSKTVRVTKGTLGSALTTEPGDLKSIYYSVEYRQRVGKAW